MQYPPPGSAPTTDAAVEEVTVSLAAPLTNSAVNMGKVQIAETVYVKTKTGVGTCTLKFNGTDATAISVSQGESRYGLAVAAIYVNSDGAGGSVVLEIHGKPLSQVSLS